MQNQNLNCTDISTKGKFKSEQEYKFMQNGIPKEYKFVHNRIPTQKGNWTYRHADIHKRDHQN